MSHCLFTFNNELDVI